MENTVYIQNLKCGGCANTIITKLSSINGISDVTVSVDEASVTYKHSNESLIEIAATKLADLGYPVLGDKNSVVNKAKSFVSCAIGRVSK